jgi:hypothetical protein
MTVFPQKVAMKASTPKMLPRAAEATRERGDC